MLNQKKNTQPFFKMNENRNKNAHLMRTLIKENIGNETGHAIIKLIYTEHRVLKFFWAFSLFLTSGFCAYLITKTFIAYFSYETFTSSKSVFETPTIFPKVCHSPHYISFFCLLIIIFPR